MPHFGKASTRIIDRDDFDVFGDGTVIIKSAPGHTPFHQVLYVKLAKTGGVVLSGDLYHYAAARELKRLPTFDVDQNQSAADESGSREIPEGVGRAVVDPARFHGQRQAQEVAALLRLGKRSSGPSNRTSMRTVSPRRSSSGSSRRTCGSGGCPTRRAPSSFCGWPLAWRRPGEVSAPRLLVRSGYGMSGGRCSVARTAGQRRVARNSARALHANRSQTPGSRAATASAR